MTRVIYGLFVAVVAVFVASNIWQVARTIFADQDPAKYAKVTDACGAAIQGEIAEIDAARGVAAATTDGAAARAAYAAARKKRAEAKNACAGDPNGTDALAALDRLDRAAESDAVRDATEIGPMRESARSFIRVDLSPPRESRGDPEKR